MTQCTVIDFRTDVKSDVVRFGDSAFPKVGGDNIDYDTIQKQEKRK